MEVHVKVLDLFKTGRYMYVLTLFCLHGIVFFHFLGLGQFSDRHSVFRDVSD